MTNEDKAKVMKFYQSEVGQKIIQTTDMIAKSQDFKVLLVDLTKKKKHVAKSLNILPNKKPKKRKLLNLRFLLNVLLMGCHRLGLKYT